MLKTSNLKIEAKLFHVYLHSKECICLSYTFLPSQELVGRHFSPNFINKDMET